MRPLRPCRQVGCSELVRPPAKYCEKHTWTDEQRDRHRAEYRKGYYKEYNRTRRDQRAQRFYTSREWRRFRTLVLGRDHYLCQICLEQKKITPAYIVDHITPISVRWDLRLDMDNCRSVCASCHSSRDDHDGKDPPGLENFLGFSL